MVLEKKHSICNRQLTSEVTKVSWWTLRDCLCFIDKSFQVCDCVNHELVNAESAAYEVSENSLRSIKNYLSKSRQRVKLNSSLSKLLEIILCVPRGSILGPILINYLPLFINEADACNFVNDATNMEGI